MSSSLHVQGKIHGNKESDERSYSKCQRLGHTYTPFSHILSESKVSLAATVVLVCNLKPKQYNNEPSRTPDMKSPFKTNLVERQGTAER
jgi:hypothetical protein